jgi:hypothetical protein
MVRVFLLYPKKQRLKRNCAGWIGGKELGDEGRRAERVRNTIFIPGKYGIYPIGVPVRIV